jgi:hypothetical protein
MTEEVMDVREEIIEGFARALHATAWADCVEEYGIENLSGVEITEVMDPVTQRANDDARNAIIEIEQRAGVWRAIGELYERAINQEGKHTEDPTPSSFGWYLGMEWLGHGVSWSDDHPTHMLNVGHGEFSYGHPHEFGRSAPQREWGIEAKESNGLGRKLPLFFVYAETEAHAIDIAQDILGRGRGCMIGAKATGHELDDDDNFLEDEQ